MNWYALFVLSGQEENVKTIFRKLYSYDDVQALVPKRKIIERVKGETSERIRKLLPGYVLIKTRMDYNIYYKYMKFPGILKLLKNGYDPVVINSGEINLILSLVGEGDIIDFSDIYLEGNKIMVTRGPMKGFEGIIEKYDKRKKRLRIRLDFLGQERKVDLGAHLIETKLQGNKS